jgi:hypothetical protein
MRRGDAPWWYSRRDEVLRSPTARSVRWLDVTESDNGRLRTITVAPVLPKVDGV